MVEVYLAASEARGAVPSSRNATADRTIDVLLLFDDEHPVLSAADVSQRLGMPRSTTYRYLQTLRSYGLVEEGAQGGFHLGPRIFQLARLARRGLGLAEVALPFVQALARETGEVVLLTRRSGDLVVCIERVEGDPRHPLRLSYERGHVLPIHAGASAKILLAFMPTEEVGALLGSQELPRFTRYTVTDPARIAAQLAAIRQEGYVQSESEVDEGVRAVAAPVFGADGQVVAGLTVAGPAFRVDDAAFERHTAAVRAAATTISKRLQEMSA